MALSEWVERVCWRASLGGYTDLPVSKVKATMGPREIRFGPPSPGPYLWLELPDALVDLVGQVVEVTMTRADRSFAFQALVDEAEANLDTGCERTALVSVVPLEQANGAAADDLD